MLTKPARPGTDRIVCSVNVNDTTTTTTTNNNNNTKSHVLF